MKQSTCPVTNPRYETLFSWRQNVRTHAVDMARDANVRSGGKILQVAALSSRNDRICLRVKLSGQGEELGRPDARMHALSNYHRFSVLTFPWDILTCQRSAPRYRTTEQFYLSQCSGKSIPLHIGRALCRPVSPTRGKSHFEKMVTRAINHSSASQRPITFSSLN